jgi:hypothetical protein
LLTCDITARPQGAPTIDDMRLHVRKTALSERTLSVTFDSGAVSALAAFMDAERQCCTEIEWHFEPSKSVLRIVASKAQLAVLQSLLQPS